MPGFEAWFTASRSDTAGLLKNIGARLEDGQIDWEPVTVAVPDSVDVEVACEPDGDAYEFELSIEWPMDDEFSTATVGEKSVDYRDGGTVDAGDDSGSWTFDSQEYQSDITSIEHGDISADPSAGEAYRAAVLLEEFINKM